MKKVIFGFLVLAAITAANGCTNKEGDADLDIITPTDSTQGKDYNKALPKV